MLWASAPPRQERNALPRRTPAGYSGNDHALPAANTNPDTSPLKVEVKTGKNEFTLQLKK